MTIDKFDLPCLLQSIYGILKTIYETTKQFKIRMNFFKNAWALTIIIAP